MALDSACGVAQSTARSNAEFEAERFRKGFRGQRGNCSHLNLDAGTGKGANQSERFLLANRLSRVGEKVPTATHVAHPYAGAKTS